MNRRQAFRNSEPSYLHGHSALPVRVLVIQAARGRSTGGGASDPGHDSAYRLADVPSRCFRRHLDAARRPRSEQRSPHRRQAAASTDGHASHDADWFASRRVRRAAAAPVVRLAGTASPVPKYISSGVCPRNAECGSTRLCSST
jgi:hypothetical protein